MFDQEVTDFPFPPSFFQQLTFRCRCKIFLALFWLLISLKTCFELLSSLSRKMEFLYSFSEVSVDSSNYHKAIGFVIVLVLFTNCCVNLPDDFVKGLRFVLFNTSVIALLSSPRLPDFYLCSVRCFCSSNSVLKHRQFLLSCPPFCLGGLSRLSCRSI